MAGACAGTAPAKRTAVKPYALVIALFVPLVFATQSAAAGYVGLGLGVDPALGGELDDRFDAESTGTTRVALGMRIGPVALESSVFGARLPQLWSPSGDAEAQGDFTPLSLGVDLKYFVPVLPRVEPYARAGLNRTWIIEPELGSFSSHSGRGYALGGGVQLPFRALVLVQGALWVDYTRHSTRLSNDGGDMYRGHAHMLMVGISIGSRI